MSAPTAILEAMENRPDRPRAYFIPGLDELDRDEGLALGYLWLAEHQTEGQPLVLMYAKRMEYERGPVMSSIAQKFLVETRLTLRNRRWRGGPVLLIWPDEKTVTFADDDYRVTSLCLIPGYGGRFDYDSWIRARGAVDLTGQSGPPDKPRLEDPVVEAGIQSVESFINQNNRLHQAEDKSWAVGTLELLRDEGHHFTAEQLYEWVLSRNWDSETAVEFRELARKILSGHRFRLRPGSPKPGRETLAYWQSRAGEGTQG